MSTRRCPAEHALRMRVSMSATGSVRLIPSFPLPAGLAHARDFSPQGELAETDTAEAELPQHGPRPPATLAAANSADLELRRTLRPFNPGSFCHANLGLSYQLSAISHQPSAISILREHQRPRLSALIAD